MMKAGLFIARHPALGMLCGCVFLMSVAFIFDVMPLRVAAEISGILTIAGAEAQAMSGPKKL